MVTSTASVRAWGLLLRFLGAALRRVNDAMVRHSGTVPIAADLGRESSGARARRIWPDPGVIRDAGMVAGSHPWDTRE